jgi:signal transduction histidine kinase
MSHELLTHLNTVIGFSQVLLGKDHGTLSEKQSKYLKSILSSGKHLMKMISGILQISKIEADIMELDISEFDPHEALQGTVRAIQSAADKKQIALSLDVSSALPNITADRKKFKEIIFHLLDNAIRFSPQKGTVRVITDIVDKDLIADSFPSKETPLELEHQRFMRIAVSDSGVGLKAEDQDRIFSIFEQADTSREQSFNGTGLGLAVSRKLVEIQNGRLWVESEGEGKGCRFIMILPLPEDASSGGIPLSDFLD